MILRKWYSPWVERKVWYFFTAKYMAANKSLLRVLWSMVKAYAN